MFTDLLFTVYRYSEEAHDGIRTLCPTTSPLNTNLLNDHHVSSYYVLFYCLLAPLSFSLARSALASATLPSLYSLHVPGTYGSSKLSAK